MKTKNIFLLFFLILGVSLAFAQGENDNWYFGRNAGVNFSGSAPIALTNGQINTDEAVGTVSDANGNLLFYTDGGSVWTREHQMMNGGFGLGGTYTTAQLSIARNPANLMQYYIFTGATNSFPNSFVAYTIVDMSLGPLGANGQPLGEVIPNRKNIPILDNNGNTIFSEAVTLVMHEDNASFWLLLQNENNLYSYRVSNTGINPNPAVSSFGFSVPIGSGTILNIKASPKLQNSNFSNYISVSFWYPGYILKAYSFDNSTGTITNDFVLEISNFTIIHAAEFSGDGKILYFGNTNLYAINLPLSTGSVVYNQMFTGNTSHRFYAMQRNKYDDIYLGNNNSTYLSKIISPNVYGGSSLNIDNVYLGGKRVSLSLPQPVLLPDFKEAPEPECEVNYTFTLPEPNVNHTYSASESIITKERYLVTADNKKIELKAGKYVSLLPNTEIKAGSDFLAAIEDCKIREVESRKSSKSKNQQKISLKLDLTNDSDTSDINVFPNPSSDFVKIDTRLKIQNWELYDLSGKIVLRGDGNRVNVKSMPSGSYLLSITFEKGMKAAKKVIVK
jgi:uncharacterized Zn ribbon protein